MKCLMFLAVIGLVYAQEDCPAYNKQGCLRRNGAVFYKQVANNRDVNSNVFTGKVLDWNNYKQSLEELACACAKKVKEEGGVAFAMTFYGVCYMATDKEAFEAHLVNPAHQSASCIGHDYSTCNDAHKECIGGTGAEYVYSFPSAAPPAINGGLGNWSEWTPCSASCGEGFQERERSCNNPVAENGGAGCSADDLSQTRTCKIAECPVDGKWSEYGSYGPCSKNCGGGTQSRSRSCNNPAPAHGGKECEGQSSESRSCNTQSCYSSYYSFRTCEGHSKSINCGSGKVIELNDYWYGRTSKSYCRDGRDWFWSTKCKGGKTKIRNTCNGKSSCSIKASNNWMGGDPCKGTPKYLWVKYRCKTIA